MTCGRQIVETITSHEKVSKAEAKERALDMIRSVGIARPEKVFSEVPAQLSGGNAPAYHDRHGADLQAAASDL